MGAEYHGYCSDITCSVRHHTPPHFTSPHLQPCESPPSLFRPPSPFNLFLSFKPPALICIVYLYITACHRCTYIQCVQYPFSGKFTADQRALYEGVLEAQRAVMLHMRPGNKWTDCHRLAERAIIANLQKMGILNAGFAVEEMVEQCMGSVFMPHGLGHLIGCDTHDVGGYAPDSPERIPLPGLNKLRTSRVLEEGMILTNEPGCYFIEALLNKALDNPNQSKYINAEVLQRFRGTGGVSRYFIYTSRR